MMNLTPTEQERLTIFQAAEFARRHKALGVKLSHPEAACQLEAGEVIGSAAIVVGEHALKAVAEKIQTFRGGPF